MGDSTAELSSLSNRAAENVEAVDHWEVLVAALANPWSPSNPNGMAILGLAENTVMHKELEQHLRSNFHIDPPEHFSYGHGPQGSPRLRSALSNFLNDRFSPVQRTRPDDFVVTTGVTALIDQLTWCICNPGEGILFPQPFYTGFINDVLTRSRGELLPTPFVRPDGSLHLDDVFDPDANVRCLERAYHASQEKGIVVRGVMITNPHNPLGKCYPTETIRAIARFCAKHNLHYLSDEIYAMSVFDNPKHAQATKFRSVTSIDLSDVLDDHHIHVLYGMSKDFCGNGLRIGCLYTRNSALRSALTSIATFGWQAYLVQDMWAKILEDKPFLDKFLTKNRERLAQRYDIAVNFLRDNKIPFLEGGNAAVFVWMDLRAWLHEGGAADGYSDLMVSAARSDRYKAKENDLFQKCWKNGVMIAKGSGCFTEQYGWFRLVFTVDEECLQVGLKRFLKVLQEYE